MAWPASQQTIADAFDLSNREALRIKGRVQKIRDLSTAGPLGRQSLLDLQRALDISVSRWNQAAGVPGIQAYARDQFNDQTLNVPSEFTTMRNAATSLRDWINANFPRASGSNAVEVYTVGTDGVRTELTFSVAQLAAFRTEADLFTATIG